jgi:hypothetical protein
MAAIADNGAANSGLIFDDVFSSIEETQSEKHKDCHVVF